MKRYIARGPLNQMSARQATRTFLSRRLGREIFSEADHRRSEPRLRHCRNLGCSRGFSNELMSISQPGNARSNWSRTTVNSAASPTVSRWMPFTTRIFIVGSNSDRQGTGPNALGQWTKDAAILGPGGGRLPDG